MGGGLPPKTGQSRLKNGASFLEAILIFSGDLDKNIIEAHVVTVDLQIQSLGLLSERL